MPPVRLCRDVELAEGRRINKDVFGRSVTAIRHGGAVYCFDSACSHMGGPLHEGDIEDINGTACIRCPWHGRKFDLGTGCQVSRDLNGAIMCSEPQQRTHTVYQGGDGWLWVDMKNYPAMASDAYNATGSAASPSKQQQQQQQAQGFGLGFENFEDMDIVGSQSSQASVQTQYGSPPQPLTPFAGFEKRALVSSPIKPGPSPVQLGQINYPGRKNTAAAVRRQRATEAIKKSTFVPPAQLFQEAAAPKKVRQATLHDMFNKQSQAAPSTIDVMDIS